MIAGKDAPFLQMKHISKRFGGTQALESVDLSLRRGEVHALLGENGAGKSTLMKILVGAIHKDSGEITIEGQGVNVSSVLEARHLGIVAIYQELTILPDLSVAQNIFLSRERIKGKTGLIDYRSMNREATSALAEIGMDIDVTKPAGSYSIAGQQMMEIAKALSYSAKVIIMDEPTSCLTTSETQALFEVIRKVKAKGTTVVYISHKMNEILQIAERGTILRDGKTVCSVGIPGSDKESLIRQMIGRPLQEEFPQRESNPGETMFEVKSLTRKQAFEDVSFGLRRGEALGIFGLLGAGRTELARAVFGADAYDSGEVELEGSRFAPKSPSDAIERGVVLIPEDRKNQGLSLEMPIARNIVLAILRRLSTGGILSSKGVNRTAQDMVKRLRIKTPSLWADAYSLSGGNQQKVVLAKWLAHGAKVFIFDEPTRGIDVDAKREIYSLINELVASGCGVILISSESEEILGTCDRMLVMHSGRIKAEFPRAEATDEKLVYYATGG